MSCFEKGKHSMRKKQKMEPLPQEKEKLFHDAEGTDRNFEVDGGSSKKELERNLDTIQKANLFNQIREGESVVKPSDKTNHIVDQDDTAMDDVSVETNLLDTFLETLVGRDDDASAKALALLEANSGIEVCQTLLRKWKQLRPLTRKFIALVAELKKTNELLTMNGINRAEKEVKELDEENNVLEESSDTLIRLHKKKKHTPVSGGKASSTKAMGIGFQEKILMNILSRLPVLPLLRFKCVSKFWKTLISDPYFNMKHLRHHENDLNSQKLLVGVNWLTLFSSSSLLTVQLVEDVQNHDCPSNCKPVHCCNIYGYCDGLVLVGVSNRYDKELLLWNPSTRESTVLPHPEFLTRSTTFGLGYDATDGYKILKLDQGSEDIELPPSYEILTLKSGSWRKIRNDPTSVCPRMGYPLEIHPIFDENDNIEPLAFLHGAFHWLGSLDWHGYSVVSFSSSDKVFREISLPEPANCRIYGMLKSDYGVSVLGGMLCFYSTHYNHQREGTFKLWIMKDYGVKESWTEMFTLKETRFCSIVPKYRFADGELLLCCRLHGRSVFRTSNGPFGLWPQIDICQDGIVYTESLISPKHFVLVFDYV